MSDQPAAPVDSCTHPVSNVAQPAPDEPTTETPVVRVVDKRWWARDDGATSADGETRSDKPSYVVELETRLAEKDDLLKDYAARYKDAAREFEETRVRVRREVSKDVEREKRKVLAAFLEVVDNLERAIEAGQSNSADSALVAGVEMVRQQFLTVLTGYGVSPIDATGAAFDPTLHDAVSAVPVGDVAQDNVVQAVIKLGYRVDDEILRPASVTVGRHDPS